ncbi:hypothetical protein N657DRAFT_340072 [Parathielavia appendiculata]|uniref:Uncharacterized protein n=1 Tax=Parathielavia appendiculata TaxID=2587402 RepID=A0AAN6Z537_9PEZI|nr:hypothetical protein N657DRAFT_340072 [Parathielavia appendiculata]
MKAQRVESGGLQTVQASCPSEIQIADVFSHRSFSRSGLVCTAEHGTTNPWEPHETYISLAWDDKAMVVVGYLCRSQVVPVFLRPKVHDMEWEGQNGAVHEPPSRHTSRKRTSMRSTKLGPRPTPGRVSGSDTLFYRTHPLGWMSGCFDLFALFSSRVYFYSIANSNNLNQLELVEDYPVVPCLCIFSSWTVTCATAPVFMYVDQSKSVL